MSKGSKGRGPSSSHFDHEKHCPSNVGKHHGGKVNAPRRSSVSPRGK